MADLIEIYDRLVVALRSEEDAAAVPFFHDDFVIYEDPGMPYGGTLQGVDAFVKLRRKVRTFWKLEIDAKCASPEGDRLVVVLRLTGLPNTPTDGLNTLVCVVWTFRGEKASEATVLYYDTPAIAGAVRAAQEAATA